jgi:hypothetical protein
MSTPTRRRRPRCRGSGLPRRGKRKDCSSPVATPHRNPGPLRVTRYVGRCDACGWQTRTCSTLRIARLALEMHQLYEHGT